MNIERVGGLSARDFIEHFVAPRKPVVLTDAIHDWPALGRWTPDWFRQVWGERIVRCRGAKGNAPVRLADYIDSLATSSADAPVPYLRNVNIQTDWPELATDISPRCRFTANDWLSSRLMPKGWPRVARHLNQLFISGTGTTIPLHYDEWMMHAFISNVHGDKEFTLFPPDQTPYLYPKDDYYLVSRIPDPYRVDPAEYPLYAKATPASITIGTSESIFLPCGWWHTTRTVSPCISVSSNFVDRTNWDAFVDELCTMRQRLGASRWKTPVIRAYLNTTGALLRLSHGVVRH
jgi:hypothetical protein